MNERELASKYLKKLQRQVQGVFVCRISDSPVGRKPFDAFLLMDGRFTAIEFKVDPNSLEPHQEKSLMDVKRAGGQSKVVYFASNGKVSREVSL